MPFRAVLFRVVLFRVVALAALLAAATSAHAACENKLGTARTITLDPARHSAVTGAERSLGLADREVILTFDDGPLPSTRKVLRALENECVRATFFVVGRMARYNGALLRRIARRHTVGHHTWGHDRLTELPGAKVGQAIDRGIRDVNRALGHGSTARPRVPFFRSPYLARNARTHRAVRARGLVEIGANIDTEDWKPQSPAQLHDRIMKRLLRHGRGIVLLHDIQPRTAAMLPRLLRSMRREGFRVVHMVPPRGRPPAGPVLALDASVRRDGGVSAPTGRPDTDPTVLVARGPDLARARLAKSRRVREPRRTSPSILTLAAARREEARSMSPGRPLTVPKRRAARVASRPAKIASRSAGVAPRSARAAHRRARRVAALRPALRRAKLRPTLSLRATMRGRFILR